MEIAYRCVVFPVKRLLSSVPFGFSSPATAFGIGRFGVILADLQFASLSSRAQTAILYHEAAHLYYYHNVWRVICLLFLLSLVPPSYRQTEIGAWLLLFLCAIWMAQSRWIEFHADRVMLSHVGFASADGALAELPESPWYQRLEWLPILTIFYFHPSIATRRSRLVFQAARTPSMISSTQTPGPCGK
jgi:Zn-dependent protease with chaperone function